MSQGDSSTTRDGSKVTPKGLWVNYKVVHNSSATTPSTCRVVIFQTGKVDTVANGLGLTELFDTSGIANTELPLLFKRWQNSRPTNYTVLHDRMFTVFDLGGTKNVQLGKVFIPAKKLKSIIYTDGAATREFGDISFFMVTDETVNGPALTLTSRLIYNDA
jgi:hypothetical protein